MPFWRNSFSRPIPSAGFAEGEEGPLKRGGLAFPQRTGNVPPSPFPGLPPFVSEEERLLPCLLRHSREARPYGGCAVRPFRMAKDGKRGGREREAMPAVSDTPLAPGSRIGRGLLWIASETKGRRPKDCENSASEKMGRQPRPCFGNVFPSPLCGGYGKRFRGEPFRMQGR